MALLLARVWSSYGVIALLRFSQRTRESEFRIAFARALSRNNVMGTDLRRGEIVA
jgi:hypothetical protein